MIYFSVIIPNYNHALYLRERIDSVLQQTYPHYEIILMDDASNDNSREILEQYRNNQKVSHIIYNEINSGFQTMQWQKGIEIASHNYIWIAESDDIAEPDFLEVAASYLDQLDKAIVFYSDSYYMIKKDKKKGLKTFSSIKNHFFKTLHWSTPYKKKGICEIDNFLKYACTINNVSCCIFPRKQSAEILRSFPHMKFISDWLFYLLLSRTCDIIYTSRCLNWCRHHYSSHFTIKGNEIQKKKEYFDILSYLCSEKYVTNKKELIKFFTEQYIAFGIWEERNFIIPLLRHFARNPHILFRIIIHMILIKITRKKIDYIF